MLMPPEAQVFITAGRRVQIIKQAPEKGGIPKSGTEIAARIGGIPQPAGGNRRQQPECRVFPPAFFGLLKYENKA